MASTENHRKLSLPEYALAKQLYKEIEVIISAVDDLFVKYECFMDDPLQAYTDEQLLELTSALVQAVNTKNPLAPIKECFQDCLGKCRSIITAFQSGQANNPDHGRKLRDPHELDQDVFGSIRTLYTDKFNSAGGVRWGLEFLPQFLIGLHFDQSHTHLQDLLKQDCQLQSIVSKITMKTWIDPIEVGVLCVKLASAHGQSRGEKTLSRGDSVTRDMIHESKEIRELANNIYDSSSKLRDIHKEFSAFKGESKATFSVIFGTVGTQNQNTGDAMQL